MTEKTRSADGTEIAYDRTGDGPVLVLLGGAFSDRHGADALVSLLIASFSVVTVDRRGRGDSGDTPPYAPAREVEDIWAVIDAVGGEAYVHGHSSGAILALEAAADGAPISRLSVYEPPYVTDHAGGEPADAARRIQDALDAGDRDGAAEAFIRNTGAPFDPAMKQSPWWPSMRALAHTLPYDLALVGDGHVPAERLAGIRVPTLAMYGGASAPWARNSTEAVAAAIPGATQMAVEGQTHAAAHDVMAPILVDYFSQA